jgi:hypothetical protein
MATATDGAGGLLFESDPLHPEREMMTPHTGNKLHNIRRIRILKVTPPAGHTSACYAPSLLNNRKELNSAKLSFYLAPRSSTSTIIRAGPDRQDRAGRPSQQLIRKAGMKMPAQMGFRTNTKDDEPGGLSFRSFQYLI